MSLDSLAFTPEQAKSVAPIESPIQKGEKKDYSDSRFFKPSVRDLKKKKEEDTRPDEYQVLIRILPRGFDYSKPYAVDLYTHFFKENNKSFFTKCRKTLGQKEVCPVCELKWEMWNIGKKENNVLLKDRAMDRKEKLSRICNIFIIKDLINPENNGKVMLWKMPNTISKKVDEAIDKSKRVVSKNAFEDDATDEYPQFYPQDPVNGRNLALIIRRDPKNNVTTYEASQWSKVNTAVPVSPTEDGIKEILSQCNDLSEFTQDIPTVQEITTRLAAFNNASVNALVSDNNEARSAVSAFDAAPTQNVSDATPKSNTPQVTLGNSNSYFEQPKQPQMIQKPLVTNTVPDVDVEEDDLPF